MDYKLKAIRIKPTLRCTANCKGCTSRRELHRMAGKNRQMSLGQWKKTIKEGVSLGLKALTISGGEPTLYKSLLDLIQAGKKYNLLVEINTNGSLINQRYAEELLDAGLDAVNISLYSHNPQAHDDFRNCKGLWNKATEAVRIFSALKKRHPEFSLRTQAILLRENFRSLDRLIKFHYDLGSECLFLSYLEGDFEGKYLLKENEITELRSEVIPKAISYCQSLDPRIVNRAVGAVKGLYGEETDSISDFAKGKYGEKEHCDVPQSTPIILANGDVHPCNIVEYAHYPVMGNLFERSLPEIWTGEEWNNFRLQLHDMCSLCPMNIHPAIPLRPTFFQQELEDFGLLHSIYYSPIFSPFRPVAKKILALSRG